MILYSLACGDGHSFESWFRDSGAFEEQSARGFVACPACGSTHVAKTIMAPAVLGGRTGLAKREVDATDEPALPAPPALLDEKRRELRDLVRGLRDKIVAEGHDVGGRFPDEARRIHDGVAPARQIYGQASVAEARDLLAEGIMVLPLPIVPDELN